MIKSPTPNFGHTLYFKDTLINTLALTQIQKAARVHSDRNKPT